MNNEFGRIFRKAAEFKFRQYYHLVLCMRELGKTWKISVSRVGLRVKETKDGVGGYKIDKETKTQNNKRGSTTYVVGAKLRHDDA